MPAWAVPIQAHIARAALLVIATPNTFGVRKMAEVARALNPAVELVVRSHDLVNAALLEQEKVGQIFNGEHELALGMATDVLSRLAPGRGPGH